MIDLNDEAAKRGAIDALTLLIQSRKRPIRTKGSGNNQNTADTTDSGNSLKMPKSAQIIDVDEEEKEEIENSGESAETEEERKTRIAKAQQDLGDEDSIKKDLDQITADIELKKIEKEQRIAAKKAEADAFLKKSKPADFSDFKLNLRRAIAQQVAQSKVPEETYSKINPSYAGWSDALMPGNGYVDKRNVPTINVYFDQSGSLGNTDIERGKDAISIIDGLVKKGEVKYNIYWFSNTIGNTPNDVAGEGGTRAFPLILDHVRETKAKNVVIFTDDDFDRQSGNISKLPYVKVPGCVWWIWTTERKIAKNAAKHLQSTNPNLTFNYVLH